ncbi:MAG: AraC family transcriptional regulator [Clostridia bacterium]|nr:AraC family transcriptional regulator [Clostridia bacterium]
MIRSKDIRNAVTLRSAKAEEVYCASGMKVESCYHGHNFYEFMICTGGKGKSGYNGEKELNVEKGFLYFSRPGEFHSIIPSTDDFEHDDVYVTRAKMKSICDSFSDNLFDKLHAIQGPIVCSVDYDKLKAICSTIDKLSNVVEFDGDTESEHSFLVMQLLSFVYEKYIVKKAPNLPKWLEEIRDRISRPENFIIPLGDLLVNSFYSRAYISVAFRKYMGETVVEYRNRIRVKYSVAMLSENDMSINRIAGILGWDNPNNYIIAFKKVYGITPLQYKNSRLKNNDN